MNKEELFNLRHASARNVIERIFGVLKRRFRILLISPEYGMEIQARVPAALCAIHNFILTHDPGEGPLPQAAIINDNPANQGQPHLDSTNSEPELEGGNVDAYANSNTFRDHIATQMWEDYERYIHEHNLVEDAYMSDIDTDGDDDFEQEADEDI